MKYGIGGAAAAGCCPLPLGSSEICTAMSRLKVKRLPNGVDRLTAYSPRSKRLPLSPLPVPPVILRLAEPEQRHDTCIEFTVRGYPHPKLRWFHKQKEIQHNDYIRTEMDYYQDYLEGCLTFQNPTHINNGNYTLEASNPLGTVTKTVYGHFIMPPDIDEGEWGLAALPLWPLQTWSRAVRPAWTSGPAVGAEPTMVPGGVGEPMPAGVRRGPQPRQVEGWRFLPRSQAGTQTHKDRQISPHGQYSKVHVHLLTQRGFLCLLFCRHSGIR